jgi:hypothetical protein
MIKRRFGHCIFFLILFLVGFSFEKGLIFPSSLYLLSVTVNKDRVTLEAEKAPLNKVLEELGQKAEVRFIYPSSLANDLISISLKDLPLSEVISRILRNYSYLMEGGEVPSVKIVASKASGEVTAGPSGARLTTVGGKGSAVSPSRESAKVDTKASPAPQPTPTVREPPPYDLDECHRLEYTEEEAAQEISHLSQVLRGRTEEEALNHQENPLLREAREAIERRLKEAKINRAKKVLETERCSNLWSQAIEELKQFQDERVTATLIEVAQTGKTERLREKAVEALWHNTADSEFKNMKGVEALRKLSQSSDPRVSMKAKQAIQDYERYIRRRK